ncbi:MAG: TetR family transcriptional regulator [Actinomycetota bacterium]|nr:TetR family transcriptional regulator [Actinomycetota bacterium]
MPRISKEESRARRDEIIDSCAALYRTENYHDITMSHIAKGVSFGRANIYNYFQCKDEIMLALLQREHELWADDLDALAAQVGRLDDEQLADGLATSLQAREQMLKLLAMNLYDMEQNSRLENLIQLKHAYGRVIASLQGLLAGAKPGWDQARIDRFTFGFMPFLHGVYPYAFHTRKQTEAMEAVGVAKPGMSLHEMVRTLALQLLEAD